MILLLPPLSQEQKCQPAYIGRQSLMYAAQLIPINPQPTIPTVLTLDHLSYFLDCAHYSLFSCV
jgi:hypothetical protein